MAFGLNPTVPSLDPTTIREESSGDGSHTLVIETHRHTDAYATDVVTRLYFSTSLDPATFRDTRLNPQVMRHPTLPKIDVETVTASRVSAERLFFKIVRSTGD
jgi:hypothetical protein